VVRTKLRNDRPLKGAKGARVIDEQHIHGSVLICGFRRAGGAATPPLRSLIGRFGPRLNLGCAASRWRFRGIPAACQAANRPARPAAICPKCIPTRRFDATSRLGSHSQKTSRTV
jgi:hypothetical protein